MMVLKLHFTLASGPSPMPALGPCPVLAFGLCSVPGYTWTMGPVTFLVIHYQACPDHSAGLQQFE